jgi:hypothetical protein
MGRRLCSGSRLAASLLVLAACASAPVPPPPVSVAEAKKSFHADVVYCLRVQDSRLGTLGPTVFQPFSGDEAFTECVSRAKANLDVAMLEVTQPR